MQHGMTYQDHDIIDVCTQLQINPAQFMKELERTRLRRLFTHVSERRVRLIKDLGDDFGKPLYQVSTDKLDLLAKFAACDQEFNRLRGCLAAALKD